MTTGAPIQPARIPVTVLTGFLGAGKTTLLNHMLREGGRRFAVLVNDFGSINIDADLIVAVEGETVSLANGCICCTIRGDLLKSALQLLGRREPPRTQLVFLSTPGDLDEAGRQAALDGCRTELPEEQAVAAQQTCMRGVTA